MLSTTAGGLKPGGPMALNPFQQIRDMQAQMARSFDQMFQQFGASPQFNSFTINPGSSLALDVQDLKNSYEVQAYVPDAKSSDVHVSLKNGRTLDVQVSHQQTQTTGGKNAATSVAEWGQYDQEVQLPTPVKGGQMKIKREGHELIIIIPKTA
jgi:HSP20 family molecular chaperone IbpA